MSVYLQPESLSKYEEKSAYGVTRFSCNGGLVTIQMESATGLEVYQYRVNLDLGYGPWTGRVYNFARFERATKRHKWTQTRSENPPLTNREAVEMAIEHLPKFITVRED